MHEAVAQLLRSCNVCQPPGSFCWANDLHGQQSHGLRCLTYSAQESVTPSHAEFSRQMCLTGASDTHACSITALAVETRSCETMQGEMNFLCHSIGDLHETATC